MLVINNLKIVFNKRIIINNFSYTFEKGQIYSINGRSGQGKTSLLNCIAMFNPHYRGNIYYHDFNIRNDPFYSFNYVSFCRQNFNLIKELSVYENIMLPFTISKTFVNQSKLKYLLDYFEIADKINEKIVNLSGGERQRVAIIRTLLLNREILLFDEPTSALDERLSLKLFGYLNTIKANKIIIVVTHKKKINNLCDVSLSLNQNTITKIHEKKQASNCIKFVSSRKLSKIVKRKRNIFSNFSITILSFGLILMFLSMILKQFINDATNSALSSFINNAFCFYPDSSNEEIDFKNIDGYEYIYYEGIEHNQKDNLKINNHISEVEFNYYSFSDYSFVFDNYLNVERPNEIDLYVPYEIYTYKQGSNYLSIYYDNEISHIKIDNVYLSDDDMCYILCNNFDYLNRYFKHYSQIIDTSIYIYGNYTLYEHFMNDKKYIDYMFSFNDDIIGFQKLEDTRFTKKQLEEFLTYNSLDDYLLSDNIHTFIDTYASIPYLILNEELVEVCIDNTLDNNSVGLTSAMKYNNSIPLFEKVYDIAYIREDGYKCIYMNQALYNSFNNDILYNGLCYQNIEEYSNVLVSSSTFSITNMDSLNIISTICLIVSIITLLLSTIISIYFYISELYASINNLNVLYYLGVNKKKIIAAGTYGSKVKLVYSTLISFLSSFCINVIIYAYYNYLTGLNLDINIHLPYYLYILLIDILIYLFINITNTIATKKSLDSMFI